MHVPTLTFDFEDERGRWPYTALFFASGLALLAGVAIPFNSNHPGAPTIAILLVAFGVGAYVWLMRNSPAVRYYRAFWLDESGIHWRASPIDNEHVVPWVAVASVEPSFATGDGGFSGLKVNVAHGYRDTTFAELVPLPYKHQRDQAMSAIQSVLTGMRNGV